VLGGKIIVPVNENMAMFCRRTIESRIPYLISKLELIWLSRRAEKRGSCASVPRFITVEAGDQNSVLHARAHGDALLYVGLTQHRRYNSGRPRD